MVGVPWKGKVKKSPFFYILTFVLFPHFLLQHSNALKDGDSNLPLKELPRQPRTESGYKISPRPCEVSGVPGTCMFVWECLKTEGQHLGMCMDGFMFGSCCVHDTKDNIISDHITTSKMFPASTTTRSTSTSTIPPRKSTYGPAQFSSHYSQPDYYQRPKRPPRPPRPSIERVGVVANMANVASTSELYPIHTSIHGAHSPHRPLTTSHRPPEVYPTRPARPTKAPSYDWPKSQTSSHVLIKPPRPPGRPPNWDDQVQYFPEISNALDEKNDMEQESQQTKWQWATSNRRPTRPPRPPKPNSDVVTFFPTTTASTTSTTTRPTTTTSTTTTSTTTTTAAPTTTRRPVVTTQAVTKSPHRVPVSAEQTKINGRSSCGEPTVMLHCSEGRIVNGSRACYGQFPWQVSVRRTSFFGFSSTHRCGGALINEYWVATAGHCVDDLVISQIRVRMGEWDFSSTTEPHEHVERKVVRKVVHPKYNFFTYENDLALVKTEKRVRFADNIIPICLPGNDDLLIGEYGTVAGWGRLSEGGVLPSILQHVSVPIVSNEKCKNMFLAAGRHEVIPDIFMCAGREEGGRDSCQGDSGGPLVVHSKEDNRWFLAGIISWGIGCAEPNLPGVCTRISMFRDWILDNVTS